MNIEYFKNFKKKVNKQLLTHALVIYNTRYSGKLLNDTNNGNMWELVINNKHETNLQNYKQDTVMKIRFLSSFLSIQVAGVKAK